MRLGCMADPVETPCHRYATRGARCAKWVVDDAKARMSTPESFQSTQAGSVMQECLASSEIMGNFVPFALAKRPAAMLWCKSTGTPAVSQFDAVATALSSPICRSWSVLRRPWSRNLGGVWLVTSQLWTQAVLSARRSRRMPADRSSSYFIAPCAASHSDAEIDRWPG